MPIIKTGLALAVKCKCESIIAVTALWGGIEIDADFMNTLATVVNRGGVVFIYNTEKERHLIDSCKCKNH